MLEPEASAALREQLFAELKSISSAEEAANWAHRVISVKNTLCDQIQRQLENIRDFFQSRDCSLSPTTFQVGNVTLPHVSLVREVELRLTAPLAKCA